MASEKLVQAFAEYEKYIADKGVSIKAIDAYFQAVQVCIEGEKDMVLGVQKAKRCAELINGYLWKNCKYDIWFLDANAYETGKRYKLLDQFYDCMKMCSLDDLECFIFAMERKRDPSKRFYRPRAKTLKKLIPHLEDLANRKIKFLGLSLPSRTGKSTLCLFFLAWIALKRPNSHSAMGGHSGLLAKGFYKELLNLITTEEYAFTELYTYWHPGHVMVCDKSAEEFSITLDMPDRFATVTCRGIDGTWTGAIDVSWDGILYVDDLVRDREHSLSPVRMENTYQEYLNKMADRKSGHDPGYGFAGACELMVGTLWNIYDPLERERIKHEGDPLYRFVRIPALDDNDESNFDYEVNGFSTEFYREMRSRLDNAEWMAKYQQRPYQREGLMMQADELRYFNGILPDGEHRNVAVVDVAWGGGDSLSMPVGAEYENGDVYIYDWVFNSSAKEITIPLVVGRIMENEIRQTRFEGDQGGELYAAYVSEKLTEQGYRCSIDDRKSDRGVAKMSKMIAYSGDVKRRFIFLTSRVPLQEELENDAKYGIKRFVRSKEYQKAMDELCSMVTIGKNEHDDALDSLTQLEIFLEGDETVKQANVIRGGLL